MPDIDTLSSCFFGQYASTSLMCDGCEARLDATVKILALVNLGYSRSAETLFSEGRIESVLLKKDRLKGFSRTASENLERLWNLPVVEKRLPTDCKLAEAALRDPLTNIFTP
jgi:hypothetical protein